MEGDEETLRVGELAKRTGLTVRTLHHYDEIGLLTPGGRTESGHRLYGVDEVRRLQQITSLRHLGVPLAEIRVCLERPDYSLAQVLEMQVGRIEEQMEHQARLRDQIEGVLARIEAGEQVGIDEVARTIEITVRCERYYSGAQLETLRDRRDEVGEARMRAAQEEWGEIFSGFAAAMRGGVDPVAPQLRTLAERSARLIEEFTGGDTGIRRSLDEMYEDEGGEEMLSNFGYDMPEGILEYMAMARDALSGSPEVRSGEVGSPGPDTPVAGSKARGTKTPETKAPETKEGVAG